MASRPTLALTPPPVADTYGTAQAAQLLGVTDRRVRQMVEKAQLPGVRDEDGTVRIPKAAVHAERRRRRGNTSGTATGRKRAEVPPALDPETLAALIEAAVAKAFESRLEITQRAESAALEALHEERSQRLAAEARVAELAARAAELEARVALLEEPPLERKQRRRFLRRNG